MVALFLVIAFASRLHPPAVAQTRQAAARDVVINEVAWAGTAASTGDEWIELYNNTAMTLSLENWRLYAADGGPTLTLHGEIAPLGYYLLERTDDTTISDIPADWIGAFSGGALGNTGEALTLADADGVTMDTANGDGGTWPGGNTSVYASMERIDPAAPDGAANWISNNGLFVNGLDADGTPLRGTPKAANSVYAADLVVGKTGPGDILPGELITYVLTLDNQGVRPAAAVLLSDTLPAALTFESQSAASPFVFTQTGNTLQWALATLPTGTQHTIMVTAALDANAAGNLYNAITATTFTRERALSNNQAAWITAIRALAADMTVDKTGALTVAPGSLLTYSIRLENIGLTAAEGIVVTDTLPHGVDFVAQQTSLAVYTFTQLNAHTLVWDVADMPVNAPVWMTVTGRALAGTFWLPLINHVAVGAQTQESDLSNNNDDWTTTLIDPREPHVLISGVLYQGYQTGQLDEAVQLVNIGPVTANIGVWELCKGAAGGLNCRALPDGVIAPATRVWLARDADAFTASFGFAPDYVLDSWWTGLSDQGDALLLRDDEQNALDALVYKKGTSAFIIGWTGPTLQPYSNAGREAGQILYRTPDEVSGLPITDTNTVADWIQFTGDIVQGRRVLYPGWDLDPLFWPLSVTEAANVMVGIAPDNAYDVISQTVMRAQESISIEVYAFRHPLLLQALVAKANAGVHVTLLLEGSTVGVGINTVEWQTQLEACRQIEATGNGECWFMIHATEANIYNRYDYIHAKIIIVDNDWVVISSQNLTRSSLPVDDKTNGTYGTRGAVVATDAPAVVARAAQVFAADFDPAHHADILRWNTGYADKYGMPIPELIDLSIPDMMSYTVRFPQSLIVHDTFDFEFFTSPEASLRRSDALLGLVGRAGAGDTVYVQQMYEFSAWADALNPRLEAYIEAARRGATVRIMVNSKSFVEGYEGTPLDSQETVSYVNAIAQTDHLNLEAFLCDPTESGIHNKMVLVNLHDEGKFSHVGSINGSETSSKVNREAAIQIKSAAVYDYLAQMFTSDWWLARPVYLPLVLRAYAAPAPPDPPVEYLVISEVYYQSGPAAEWVEIYNPTDADISLNGYKIGDYDGAGYSEGIYAFPVTATIPPGEVIVIAGDGHQISPPADFEFFDFNPDIPTLQKVGGDGDWALGNVGDQVILRGPNDQPVDVLVWGTAVYPGVIAHPGVTISTHSLERYPAYYDTNDCNYDFRDRYPTSPGALP